MTDKAIKIYTGEDKAGNAKKRKMAARTEDVAHNFLCAMLQSGCMSSGTTDKQTREMAWRLANGFVEDAERLREAVEAEIEKG